MIIKIDVIFIHCYYIIWCIMRFHSIPRFCNLHFRMRTCFYVLIISITTGFFKQLFSFNRFSISSFSLTVGFIMSSKSPIISSFCQTGMLKASTYSSIVPTSAETFQHSYFIIHFISQGKTFPFCHPFF